MLESTLTGIAVAIALGTAPATAQQTPPGTAQQESSLVGLPIYSSDGEKLGEVTDVTMHEGQQAVLAEMGTFLGIGTKPVLIPAGMVTRKGGRVELPMTAGEVKNIITKR
jgi:sporulation protein YlmC with PRC-barrel domain